MTEARYPLAALTPDLIRSGFGVAACTAVLTQLDGPGVAFWILVALTTVFALFGGLTAFRATLRIRFDAQRLDVEPGGRSIEWAALSLFRLDYYATRRDREQGWMQLRLAGADGQRIKLDSRLDGFESVVELAARAARHNGLEMDMSTLDNLAALARRTGGVDAFALDADPRAAASPRDAERQR